jgi:hypothetical protein
MRPKAVGTVAMSLALLLALAGGALPERKAISTAPVHDVIDLGDASLTPQFWISRVDRPGRVILDPKSIAAQNARLRRLDHSVHDLRAMPATLKRAQVVSWIEALSRRRTSPRYDVYGRPVAAATFDGLTRNLAIDTIPAQRAPRYGLVVRRANLRTFPTALQVFSRRGQVDIDRFQESALFPGTPVVIAHESRDHEWWFVISPRYVAWIPKRDVAEIGDAGVRLRRQGALPCHHRPRRTHRLHAREPCRLGTPTRHACPSAAGGLARRPGSARAVSLRLVVIELALRDTHGRLRLTHALLPRSRDTSSHYLPLTRANLLWQAFKFLGERYGWGDMYDARDCSSFVSDVYRSMGVELPRNTGDQEASPALEHRLFTSADGSATRRAAVRKLQVGDLVYIPRHVTT